MTVLAKTLKRNKGLNAEQFELLKEKYADDELIITTSTSHKQESAMPDSLKNQVRENSPLLLELFHQTIKDKGDDLTKRRWVGDQTLEVDGLSHATLHSFILEAEKLGKSVEYVKTLTVKIAD